MSTVKDFWWLMAKWIQNSELQYIFSANLKTPEVKSSLAVYNWFSIGTVCVTITYIYYLRSNHIMIDSVTFEG